jgi:biopolymer transport protein ExbB/TolQ
MQELVTKAGYVGWPLVLCSVLALTIVLERLWTLGRLKTLEERAFLVLQMALEKGDTSALRDPAIAAAPVTVVLETLTEMGGASEASLQRAAEIAISMQRMRLRRALGALATISSTAPFIGLFGTVFGIMNAFRGMGSGPNAQALDNAVLMQSISEALSATALGLLVAIPSVIAYNSFAGRVQASVLQIHGHVARLVPLLYRVDMAPRPEATHAR